VEPILEPKQCPVCFTINNLTDNFCSSCGLALTKNASERKLSIERFLETNPDYAEIAKILPVFVRREVQKRLSENGM
jgi:hypothetical protein